ncbi:hypothetical protein K2Q16_02085 [Patescibacteria group bacterium]|nr:hypothetical protein [Patescibacteria group bacterium]
MEHKDILSEWRGRTAVLATMHSKEVVISPLIKEGLGIDVMVPANFNTDQFGTFTREVERAGDQLEAARKKARAAVECTGMDVGIASEGSFGSHPSLPFVPSSLEIVVLVDVKNDIEVVGHYRSSSVLVRGEAVRTPDEAVALAVAWGFPEQGIIVRGKEKSSASMYKELRTTEAVRAAAEELLSKWFCTSIFIETDMRAHRCPARRENIGQATADLIRNCKSLCPRCHIPGFVVTEVIKGLPCCSCGLATDLAKATVRSCKKCQHTVTLPIEQTSTAEPGECQWCNP